MPYPEMLVRPAMPEDAMAVARVHVRSWQTAYRTLLPDDYLDQLRPEDRAAKYDFVNSNTREPWTIVAVKEGVTRDGLICGFATTAPSREPDLANYGELYALYVDPDYWGHGIGIALITAARGRLLELGFQNAFLWVLKGNIRAERFYQRDGWMPDGVRRTQTVWGITVDEIRYQRRLAES